MKLESAFAKQRWMAALGFLVVTAGIPRALRAQTADSEPTRSRRSRVLFGNKDGALSDSKMVGFFKYNTCITNGYAGLCNFPLYVSDIGNGLANPESGSLFGSTYFRWGVPKTDWDSARAKVPSLNNVTLGPGGTQAGWTVDDPNQVGVQDIGPADGGLGLHHAGVQSTADRSCLDHTNSLGSGTPLLAGSDCPVTWGSEGWKGARPVPSDVFKTRFNADPTNFQFDFWKVTDAELDAAGITPPGPGSPGKTIGNFQTYGYTSDHTSEILCGTSSILSYGNIIPATSPTVSGGCSGNPVKPGWPVGLTVRFDLFTFQLPALKEIVYVQALVINNSRDVYGVPLDYDSLYIDLGHDWFHTEQRTMVYDVPQQGALYAVRGPIRPCQAAREVVDLTCTTWNTFPASAPGFISGALSLMILRSPIGDLRNKLFTETPSGAPCTPGVGFCSPGNIHAGDTLTYNHHHLCGFRACAAVTDRVTYTTPQFERWAFGLISSTEENIIAGRPGGSSGFGGTIAGQRYWHVFRDAGFGSGSPDCSPGEDPTLGMCWNRMVPSGWDYNHDGVPDTLHLDGCFLTGCAGLWGDSLPAIPGATGRMPTYSNSNAVMAVGPIKLNAGDTTAFVFALTQGKDSSSIMIQARAAIDNYMNFFLAPDAASKCNIVGVLRGPVAEGAGIKFAWDDACFAGKWTDKFLAKQYADLVAADPNSPSGILRRLNPWLTDTLLFLSTNNLNRLYVFKSCDGGNTWTNTTTCASAPATGGPLKDVGFLPYATFNSDDPGGVPSSFIDLNVQGGLTYTYNLIGETRGANFQVVNGDSTTVTPSGDTVCAKNCRAETLSLAPVLFNGLTGSTSNPNVARVYLAVSRQGGAARPYATATAVTGPLSPSRIAFFGVSDSVTPASYTVSFGDSGHATQVEVFDRTSKKLLLRVDSLVLVQGTTAQPAIVSTTIYDTVKATPPVKVDTIHFGGITPSGATQAASVSVGVSDSTVTTQYTWVSGPVMALVRIENKAKALLLTGGPLLVSNTLSGVATTPTAFHDNPDYPRFDPALDASLGVASSKRFDQEFFLTDSAATVPVPLLASPTVTWRTILATQSDVTSALQDNGDYQITWLDKPFGPGELFRLNFSDPQSSVNTIVASLNARQTATTGAVDTATARALTQALGTPVDTSQLVAVKLPFRVRNLSYGRVVTVAMRKRPTGGNNSTVLVGCVGSQCVQTNGLAQDTIRVPVPTNVWVPGDTLFFLEPVNGTLQATFSRAVLGCDPSAYTRLSCNPVYPTTRGSSTYLGDAPGEVEHVRYYVPVTPASAFTFAFSGPLRGAVLEANGNAVVAAVKVVPNPYVMSTPYPGSSIMFTHVPPAGVLRIYTVSGQFVQQITWDEASPDLRLQLGGDGDLLWNLRSREGNFINSGLYLFVLTGRDAAGKSVGTHTGKFMVIR